MTSTDSSNEKSKPGEDNCPKCMGAEFVFSHVDDLGYEFHKPCDCREKKSWKRRFNNALIPDEFVHANFENYICETEMQKSMYDFVKGYLDKFPTDREQLKKQGAPNLGLIAVIGEQRIRSLESHKRLEIKNQHNNYGIGKTHLQIALAKQLIKQGFNVLVVSDVSFMDEMMNAKRMSDGGEMYNGLLTSVLTADVLVWDDIGKAKWTEAREGLYYNILNERYKRRLPIVFNSNEDKATIGDRVGYAANSRLLDKSDGNNVMETEGVDWRLK
ncbi:ATP-binding protein [Viridibacillus arvi]|uniref:ATP-binding protein n=1 Tax=Viridibacillus arvi TaxID=263475 RepID=UPI003D27360A